MRPADFDELVEDALRKIPERFRERLANVSIVVEDEPSRRQLMAGRVPPGNTLLGLYEGRPLPYRSWSEGFGLPDRITLFQGPIERAARGPGDVGRVVADTLWHEVAHYFGMNERQVRSAERRRFFRRSREPQR